MWGHRIITLVTSPGVVRFAPHHAHSGMPRLFPAAASLAMLRCVRPRVSGAVHVTLCALRLGEPTHPSRALTRFQRERLPLRFQVDVGVHGADTSRRRILDNHWSPLEHPFTVSTESRPQAIGTESRWDDVSQQTEIRRFTSPVSSELLDPPGSGTSTLGAETPVHRVTFVRRAHRRSPVRVPVGHHTRFACHTSHIWSGCARPSG